MKDKVYWTVRKKFKSLVHRIKSGYYSVLKKYEKRKQSRVVFLAIAKRVVRQTVTNIVPVSILVALDRCVNDYLIEKQITIIIDKELPPTLIIGGIGVAGIFLGLYCANVTSIYTTKYTNAPDSIGNLFENDAISNSSISHISNYILFSTLLVSLSLIDYEHGIISLAAFLLFTIWLIISFGMLGNKRHRLSDTYGLADQVYKEVIEAIEKATQKGLFGKDINFQNHYQLICGNHIQVLHDIAKYSIGDPSNRADAMLDFSTRNNALLSFYWKQKSKIPFTSKWYRDKSEYEKWHLASDQQVQIAFKTGTALPSRFVQNDYWLEDSVFAVNDLILTTFINSKDWKSLYSYCLNLGDWADSAVLSGSAGYFLKYVKEVVRRITEIYFSELSDGKRDKDTMAGLIDAINMILLSMVLAINKYLDEIKWDQYLPDMLGAKKYRDINLDANPFANNRRTQKLYNGIHAERLIEKKRITSDWFIEQTLAHSIFEYIQELVEVLNAVNNDIPFNIGKQLYDSKAYLEAMLVFSRMAELKSKSTISFEILGSLIPFLKSKHFEKTYIWPDNNYELLVSETEATSRKLPFYWSKCAGGFAIEHWKENDNCPDIVGQCYNYMCEYLMQALIALDFDAFESAYPDFLGVMLLYQEFTRQDVLKVKEPHQQNAVVNLIAKPMVEYSTLSGYAYLWGELIDQKWKTLVISTLDAEFGRMEDAEKFYTQWVVLCNFEENKPPAIYDRDMIQTEWNMRIEKAIRDNDLLEYGDSGPFGSIGIKTDNQFLKAFLGAMPDMIFHHDVYEVYLILCVNKYLPNEKQYESWAGWEKNNENS